jgi:serine/threonine-protein kinase
MSLIGRLLGGRYEVLRVLGTGGMGAVYEAQQRDLQRLVAIKVLHEARHDPADLARFRQEAQAAASLAHPNIVQIIDFVANTNEPPFIVMELLRGRALSTVVRAEGPLDPARAVGIAGQVLAALGAAHRARIIHRDVKPENVFVCDPSPVLELVKVLDFGFAKPLDSRRRFAETQTGYVVGTPAYMAPEQAAGAAADARMDLYAAGICLYFALSGRRPFDGPTTSALLYAIKKQPPLPLAQLAPHVDLGLVRVVERSLAKDPDDRFATAEEFIAALAPYGASVEQRRASLAPKKSIAPETKPQGKGAKPSLAPTPVHAPKSPFRVVAGRIADRMVRYARFAPAGTSAMAVGPTGLAKWAGGAWAGRPLPSQMHAEWVRGFEFVSASAPSATAEGGDKLAAFTTGGVDSLLYGIDGRAFLRDARSFRELVVGEDLALLAAHADHEASILFAVVVMTSSVLADRGLVSGDGAILHVTPARTTAYPVGRNVSLFAITRARDGAVVACGERGALCVLDAQGAIHARPSVSTNLSAVAPVGAGAIAVGREGTAVFLPDTTAAGVAGALIQKLAGPSGPVDLTAIAVSPTGHVWVGGQGCLFAGAPNDLRLVAAGGSLDAPIVAIWAGEGRARILLENAAILELDQ